MTASEILEAAELRAYPSLTLQKISDKLMVSRLSELDRRAYMLATQLAPEKVLRQGTVVTLDSDYSKTQKGYSLPDAVRYLDFFYQDTDNNIRDLRIVTSREQYTVQSGQPAGIIKAQDYGSGARLFPVDPIGKNWEESNTTRGHFKGDGDQILWRYVPKHQPLSSKEDTLYSPDEARSWLEESLLEFILYSVKQPLQSRDTLQDLWRQYMWDLYNFSQLETNWSGWRHSQDGDT